MAAAKGNQNAKGNKGGGRKSAYEEAARAEKLIDAWFGSGVSPKKLKELEDKLFDKDGKIKKDFKGKLKFMDLFFLKSIKNNSNLMSMFQKLFPDKIETKSDVNHTHRLDDHTLKLIDKYKK